MIVSQGAAGHLWRLGRPVFLVGVLVCSVGSASAGANPSGPGSSLLQPGNLLVARSVYEDDSGIVAGVTQLPPGCTTGCVTAVADGSYPAVWNNDLVDASFGITSKLFLDQRATDGSAINSIEVPNSTQNGTPPTKDQMVTSFSSKSEVALNLSTNGTSVTFMGYLSPVGAVDVSNSNTPAVIDPTNPVPGANYRVVAQLDSSGKFRFTETNAYSGNNGRAAILNDQADVVYTAGNAGNGGSPQPDGVIVGAGAQIISPEVKAEVAQRPGFPTPVGSFNITQLGQPPDKVGKDTNFRGLTISNNVVYYTKGSGGNGVNTVYFVDTTGSACPSGVGLPATNASLPTSPIAYDPANLQTSGVPTNMCILKGFPTALKSKTSFPFGIWFANPTTLYVADEGNGTNSYSAATGRYTAAAAQTTAGLQKWVLDPVAGTWKLAYTLQNGLQLGVPYAISGYPTGDNAATGLPWAPGTDGLRNLTGRVNPDGTATIWAATSTVSGNGDQGADPNQIVAITDRLAANSVPAGETFTPVDRARAGEVLRGISFAPRPAP
jgi:hypothetical protein